MTHEPEHARESEFQAVSGAPDAEFDAVAASYAEMHRQNIQASGDDPEFFARYKIEDIAEDRTRRGLKNAGPLNIVDFGAGIGASLPHLRSFFPNARIIELDVSVKSLDLNRQTHGDMAEYLPYDGQTIPLADESVDFAIAACVFHHIPHSEHVRLIKELKRTLRPGGDFYIFEHNPWNPLTLHAVNTCPFDANAVLINGPAMAKTMSDGELKAVGPVYRYFYPSQLAALRGTERMLRFLPVGAQYYVRGQKR